MAGRQPIWLRLIAILCVLLIGIASTAEVCHTHPGASLVTKGSGQNVPAPDHCPLCVAMHSALPTTAGVSIGPALHTQPVALRVVATQRVQQWSFELFSRPPPVVPSVA
jgi:hypothetical protein